MGYWIYLFSGILIGFGIGVLMCTSHVFGQDIDPRYYCLYANQYPFSELCNQQKINQLMNELDQRAQEWNTNHTAFKITSQLENETKLLQTCIKYNISDMHCNRIWGGPLN